MSKQQISDSKRYSREYCVCVRRCLTSVSRQRSQTPSLSKQRTSFNSKQYFRVCFCFRRIFRIRVAEPPEDVREVFDKFSENGNMSVDQLLGFLQEIQGERNATREDALAIFNNLKHLNIFQRKELNLHAFFRFLLSDHINPPLSPSIGVHHDMNAPLAHYFLYTGHNSYLTGNQFSSDCSVDPIIQALQRGVRVIELDLWPNSTRDDVDVRHGGALTTPVDLITCLRAIHAYAFVASEYPLVLTFEDHLTAELQDKVATMVMDTFGDALFQPGEALKVLPSPESLKGKIMISTKLPKEYLESQSKVKGSAEEEQDNQVIEKEIETEDKDGSNEGEDRHDVVPQYKHLIAIHADAGKTKGGMEEWFVDDPNEARRISLSEQDLENAVNTYAKEIVRFTQRNLLRVYPKGLRFDSSNYDPLVGWTHGAQMVAFNMQGYGKYLWIMQGMFRANGGCGYVKKPDFLLDPDRIFDPREVLPIKEILKVKVYLGEGWHSDFRHTHFDPYSPPDFYTKVGIVGVRQDEVRRRTKAIEDDWNPVWDEEFEFKLRVPELALLRVEVVEYDTSGKNDFGGQTYLPISELRTGFRAVPLYNRKGEKYKSVRLLMRFQFV